MVRVLLTGVNGQRGSGIRKIAPDKGFFFTDKMQLDICDKVAVEALVVEKRIDTIINCAAYTALDKAEEERINHEAVRNLVEVAKARGVKFIHISTNYVFNGRNYKSYTETDPTNPTGVYGKSKLIR